MSEMSMEEWQRGYDNRYRWKWGQPYFFKQRVSCTDTWTHRIEYNVLYPGERGYPAPPSRTIAPDPKPESPSRPLIRISQEMRKLLKAEATRREIPMSALVRVALEEFFQLDSKEAILAMERQKGLSGTLEFRLPPTLAKQLDAEAQRQAESKSSIVRHALRYFLRD